LGYENTKNRINRKDEKQKCWGYARNR